MSKFEAISPTGETLPVYDTDRTSAEANLPPGWRLLEVQETESWYPEWGHAVEEHDK